MKLKKQAFGKSYAKIILFGEHSVVYNQPAIAIPLYSVDVNVEINKAVSGQTINCRYFDGPVEDMQDNLAGLKKLIYATLKKFSKQSESFEIKISSKLPAERGMGSSAATAVAVTRALFDYFDVHLNRDSLLEIADIEEKVTHGNPSGIDSATVSSDGGIWFIKGHENEQFNLNLPTSSLVIADSGIKGKTSEAVSLVARNLLDEPEKTKPLIKNLGEITNTAKEALTVSEPMLIGKLMDQAQKDLSALGVSNKTLDKMCAIAKTNGALGAKLTGSGLGGCMIALAPSQESAQKIATALRTKGATKTWIQTFKNYEFSMEESNGDAVK